MERYVRKTGIVCSAEDGNVLIRVDLSGSAASLPSCAGCGCCSGGQGHYLELSAPLPEDLSIPEPGSLVRVEYLERNSGLGALLFFLPSMLGLILGGYVFRKIAGEADVFFVIGAFAGLALGFLLAFLVNRFLAPEGENEAKILGFTDNGEAEDGS